MYNVFLSYLRDDKPQALRLADELQSNGAVVWVDVSDLAIGSSWREEIAQAIRQAEFFVACFSSTCEERPDNGMLDELNYAISLRKGDQKHPEILPVKLNECDIPDLQIDSNTNLNELHWYLLDGRNWGAGVKQLVEITLRKAKERAKIRLEAEAKEISVKNAQLVRAKEELRTHEIRTRRLQRSRETNRRHSTARSNVELPAKWPAQNVAKRELEYENALAQYNDHQVKFVQRFDEDYHPMSKLFVKMHEEEKLIHQSFEDARRAEAADIAEGLKGLIVLAIFLVIVGALFGLIAGWLKSC